MIVLNVRDCNQTLSLLDKMLKWLSILPRNLYNNKLASCHELSVLLLQYRVGGFDSPAHTCVGPATLSVN